MNTELRSRQNSSLDYSMHVIKDSVYLAYKLIFKTNYIHALSYQLLATQLNKMKVQSMKT